MTTTTSISGPAVTEATGLDTLRDELERLARQAVFLPPREWDAWCDDVLPRLHSLRKQLERARPDTPPAAPHRNGQRALLARVDALVADAHLQVEPPLWAGALRELLEDVARSGRWDTCEQR